MEKPFVGTMSLTDTEKQVPIAVDFRSVLENEVVLTVHSDKPFQISHQECTMLGVLLLAISPQAEIFAAIKKVSDCLHVNPKEILSSLA